MSLRKFLIISVAVCLPAGAAWILLGSSIYFERVGMKPIASYAPISAQGDCLKVGGNSQDDIILPEYTGTDSVCLASGQGEWQLAPGGGGGTVGDTRGAKLEMLKSYSIANHQQHAVIEVSRAVRISIRDDNDKPIIVIFDSRPGSTLSLPELRGAVLSANPDIKITLGSRVKRLRVNREVKMGDLRVECLPANPSWMNHHKVSDTPFMVSISQDGHAAREEILWPGTSLDLSDEQVVIKASREHTPEVTLSMTDPKSATAVTPGQEDRGIAKGSIDQPLTIEDRTYQLLPMASTGDSSSQPNEFVILVRAPKALDRWRFFLGGPIQSWDDAALFSPYPFVPIAACDSGKAAAQAQPPAANNGGTATTGPANLPAGATADAANIVGPATAPVWLSKQERSLRLSVCKAGGSFRVAALDNAGNLVAVPLDGVIKRGDTSLRAPARATVETLSAGDMLLYRGRTYQLIGDTTPAVLVLYRLLAPLVFVAAAFPLLWLLAGRHEVLWRRLASYEGTKPDKFLRSTVIFAPIAGVGCILGLMTIGAYFQLSLAASSELAANARFFNIFLTSCTEALAFTSLIIRWMDLKWTWKGLAFGIRDALWAFALGTMVLEWVEPLLARYTLAGQRTRSLIPYGTDRGWWVPLVFLGCAACVARFSSWLVERESSRPAPNGAAAEVAPVAGKKGSAAKRFFGYFNRVKQTFAHDYERGSDDLSDQRPGRRSNQGDSSSDLHADGAGKAMIFLKRLWRAVRRSPVGYFYLVCIFYWAWILFPIWRLRKILFPFIWADAPKAGTGNIEAPAADGQKEPGAAGGPAAKPGRIVAVTRSSLKAAKELSIFAVLGVAPLGLLWLFSRWSDFVANVGKETIPPLLLLCAVFALGGLGIFAQSGPPQADPDPKDRLLHTIAMTFCVLVFSAGMLCLPLLFTWIYSPPRILIAFAFTVATSIAIWWIPDRGGEVPGVLLYNVLPFYGALLAAALVFADFGAMLVWTWALSWVGAWDLMLNVLLAGTKRSWKTGLGALVCSLNLIAVPLTLLGVANFLRGTVWFPKMVAPFGATRALDRFRLAAAPFYYDAGEWLARVQLMALGPEEAKHVHWMANLNSDVALNGLHYVLPEEHEFAVWLFTILFIILAFCFEEAFRYAVQSTDRRPYFIRASLAIATAFFGLGMFLFVHLGASLFDILPLTGVPCPWISHALIVHVVMTALVVGALFFAGNCADPGDFAKGGPDAAANP